MKQYLKPLVLGALTSLIVLGLATLITYTAFSPEVEPVTGTVIRSYSEYLEILLLLFTIFLVAFLFFSHLAIDRNLRRKHNITKLQQVPRRYWNEYFTLQWGCFFAIVFDFIYLLIISFLM